MAKRIKLVFEVQGAGDAEKATKKVDSSLTGLAKKAGLVATAFIGTGKLIDAFKGATRVGAEFEQNIKNLSVIAGATRWLYKIYSLRSCRTSDRIFKTWIYSR